MSNPLRCRGLLVGMLVLLFSTLFWSTPARADGGMAFVDMAFMSLFLLGVFVVGLEAWVINGMLKTGWGPAWGVSGLVNTLSWLACLPIYYFICNTGPLFDEINQYRNPLLSVGLVACVFLLTLAIEAPLLKAAQKKAWRPVLKASLTANIVSYMLVIPMMGPFSYFPDYGVRSLLPETAEALGEEFPAPAGVDPQEVVTIPPPRSDGSSAGDP